MTNQSQFNWPRFRHSLLEMEMKEDSKIENFCTEITFVERPYNLNNYVKSDTPMEVISLMKDTMISAQRIIPLFIEKCKQGTEIDSRKLEAFYPVLRRFCENFPNQSIECNIGELHFHLNHLLVVVLKIIGPGNEEYSIAWGAEKWERFESDIDYLINMAASEYCSIKFAESKRMYYPSNSLFSEVVQAVLTNAGQANLPKIIRNDCVLPLIPNGETKKLEDGIWILEKTVGTRLGLFGSVFLPKFTITRVIMFYSRLSGPKQSYKWNLEGPITFEASSISEKAIDMPQGAPTIEWTNLVKNARSKAELIPEPFESSSASRILKSFEEY